MLSRACAPGPALLRAPGKISGMSWTLPSKRIRGKVVFSDGGYMPSIPPLHGGKTRCCWPLHPLRMANCLMAALADTDEIALTLPFCVQVVNIQSKIRPVLHMVDMMDQICPVISTFCFAYLALAPVCLKHICTQGPPFGCNVKGMYIPCCYQCPQPG